MHILVIPSEEFVPDHDPLAGIFQQHQMNALARHSNNRLGFISVRLKFSPMMIARVLIYKLALRQTGNELDSVPVGRLFRMLWQQFFNQSQLTQERSQDGFNGVSVQCFYLPAPSSRTDWRSWIRGGLLAYDHYAREYGTPDLIHAHNALYAGLLAEKIHQTRSVPYLLTEHSSYFIQGLVPEHLIRRTEACYRNARATIAVSESLRESLNQKVSHVCRSMKVVPNVLDPIFEQDYDVAGPKPDRKCVQLLAIGNLLEVKGHRFLLEALPQLEKLLPDRAFHLRIGGDGELREQLRETAELLHCHTTVAFLGRLSREQVITEILDCDLLVLPSLTETFGVVVIEAQALGRPVVATRCGGPNLLIDKNSGVLVEPADSIALAEGISQVASCIDNYEPEAIRKSCLAKFGSETFASVLNKIYFEALQ